MVVVGGVVVVVVVAATVVVVVVDEDVVVAATVVVVVVDDVVVVAATVVVVVSGPEAIGDTTVGTVVGGMVVDGMVVVDCSVVEVVAMTTGSSGSSSSATSTVVGGTPLSPSVSEAIASATTVGVGALTSESELLSTTRPPITTTLAAADDIIHSATRRPSRPVACSNGNPVDGSAVPNEGREDELLPAVVDVWACADELVDVDDSPPKPPDASGCSKATCSRIDERKPIGAANAGAAPTSASGANRRRERSQVLHASICRDTRLRRSTVKSPDQPCKMRSSSSHSLRPRLATQYAPRLRSVLSRMRWTSP